MGRIFSDKIKNFNVDLLFARLGIAILVLMDILVYSLKGKYIYIQAFIVLSSIPIIFMSLYPYAKKHLNFINGLSSNVNDNDLLLFVLFSCLLDSSILSFMLRPSSYTRPISFFILISLSISILVFIIINNKLNKYKYLILSMIILLSIVLRFVPLSMIPGLYYDDPMFHQNFAEQIQTSMHIPQNNFYTPFPLMHLILVISTLLTELTFKYSSIFVITFSQAALIPTILFLLGEHILKSSTIGFLSALIFSFSDIPLRYGITSAFPTTYSLILFSLLIFIIFTHNREQKVYLSVLIVILILTIILSHSLTPLALLLFVIVSFLVQEFYIYILRKNAKSIITKWTIALLFASMISYWIYNSYFAFNTLVKILFIPETNGVQASFSTAGGLSFSQSIPTSEYMLDLVATFVLFSFSSIGFLYSLSIHKECVKALAFTINSMFFMLMGSFSLLLVIGIAPERFLYYSYLFLPITSAIGILTFAKSTKKKISIFTIVIIFVLPFFMITNSISNTDSPIFSKDMTAQRFLSQSEALSLHTISRINNSKIYTDNDFSTYLTYIIGNNSAIPTNFFTKEFLSTRGYVITRKFYGIKPSFSQGLYRVNYDVYSEFEKYQYQRVYDSEYVDLYYK